MTFPVEKHKWHRRFASVLVCLLTVLSAGTLAQRRRPVNLTTGFDDVVFAISFRLTAAPWRLRGEPPNRRSDSDESNFGTLNRERCVTSSRALMGR